MKTIIRKKPRSKKCASTGDPRLRQFRREFQAFKSMPGDARSFEMEWSQRLPCLDDRTAGTSFDRHYVYHTAWAARVVKKIGPDVHVDISSSLFFGAIASAFIPIKYYEYRPVNLALDGLTTDAADLMGLPFDDRSVDSISCMHVVEHVGLGRYGDPLDPSGDLKAMAELQRVVAPGGSLLFVVPVGRPRIVFNAHRIYAFEQITRAFDGLELVEFALVPDGRFNQGIVVGVSAEFVAEQNYGCGCFWFRRSKEAA